MRFSALFFSLLALIFMAGCTIGPDGKPHMIDAFPLGYSTNSASWQHISGYDANDPSLPQPWAEGPIAYNDEVTVYPLDGDVSPYENRRFVDIQTAEAVFSGAHSGMAQRTSSPAGSFDLFGAGVSRSLHRVFFAHGSSRLSESERARLSTWVRTLRPAERSALGVTGHASHRVNGMGSAQRQAVNDKIAQKRADAVAAELRYLGAGVSTVTSAGDDVPNPQPTGMSQEAADRRVDVRAFR